MAFPETPRVKFKRNPLVEVACELSFTSPYKISDLEQSKVEMLHEHIKHVFPSLKRVPTSQIEYDTQKKEVKESKIDILEFVSGNELSKILLRDESVILRTYEYESWETFKNLISTFLLEGLQPTFGNITFKRVGLRYKDIIERRNIGLENAPWTELLNPYLSSIYSVESGLDNIVGHQSTLLLKLDEGLGSLNFRHGIVLNESTKDVAYLLDGDFFIEGEGIEYERASEQMDKHNISARKLFRWCITDKLYTALHPQPLE